MLYTPLSVRYIAGIQPDAELFTGVSKLCLCILIKRWRVFSFVIENGTIISEDFSRDAIGSQNLLEYMVIGMKRFLRVTPPVTMLVASSMAMWRCQIFPLTHS